MRKKLITYALCLCFLVGCTPHKEPDDSALAEPFPLPTANSDDITQLDFNIVSGSSAFQLVAGGNSGAYRLIEESGKGAHLIYMDYASGQELYWTDQLTPSFDETDPGWIENTFGGVKPLADGDNVYVFKYGKIPLKNVGIEGAPSQLHWMNADGMVRYTITQPADCPIENQSIMVSDGQELYLLTAQFDELGYRQNYQLCRTDFVSGKLDVLSTMDAVRNRYWVIGTWPEGIVLQHATLPPEAEGLSGTEQLDYYQYELLLYSVQSNTMTPAGLSWKQGELTLVPGDGCVYYVLTGDWTLHCLDFVSGQESEMPIQWEEQQNYSQLLLSGDDYGTHLKAYAHNETASQMVSIEKATGQITKMTLTFEYDQGYMPMEIVTQSNSQFVVRCGMEIRTANVDMGDGTYHTTQYTVPRYALIDKQDYWNSQRNLTLFEGDISE